MKKIMMLIGVLLLVGCSDPQEKTYQYHEGIETNIQYKEVPEPDPVPEVIEEDPEPEVIEEDPEVIEEDPEEIDYIKLGEEIEHMTQEERSQLSQEIKDIYGISEEGSFYSESGSSKEQIEHNN